MRNDNELESASLSSAGDGRGKRFRANSIGDALVRCKNCKSYPPEVRMEMNGARESVKFKLWRKFANDKRHSDGNESQMLQNVAH